MPSTKDIEQFRKYLNRTLREDFLNDLKAEQSVLHDPIETTTPEAQEMRNILAGDPEIPAAANTEETVRDTAENINASTPIEQEKNSEEENRPAAVDLPEADINPDELSFRAADPDQSDRQTPLSSEAAPPSEEESDLSEFLNMDWSKDPVKNESADSSESFNENTGEIPPQAEEEKTEGNEDSTQKTAVPDNDQLSAAEDSSEQSDNHFPDDAGLSAETDMAKEGPGSFFSSGSDSGESLTEHDWNENFFDTEPSEANRAETSDGTVTDTGWAPTDLGEVPDSFDTVTGDSELDLGHLPQFANEDEDESKVTFEEKFGEKKKPVKKKKVHYSLSERESDVIFRYLDEFPRNVKIACQRFITSDESDPDDVVALIELLKAEESIKVIVRFLEEKTGTHISIPRGFEKINGKAYLEKINSPGYIFRTKILPVILKSVIAGLFVLFTIAASVFLFIPAARGSAVYRSGYNDIQQEEYPGSMEKFHQAFAIWPSRGWSYKYAQRYIEKRQYVLAEEIYDNLISDNYRPYDRKGRLDYCRFESEILGDYRKADMIIQPYLDYDRTDSDAHLEAARNYLRWSYFDSSRLESARMAIVAAGENGKYTDKVLFEMLHYMILSDRYDDVLQMWETYRDKPRKKLDLTIFGKLAGYFIDKDEKELANAVIKRMYKQDKDNLDAHFQWARLSRIESEWTSMENAVNNVLYQLSQRSFLTRDTLSMKILSLNMKAIAEYKRSEFLLTQRDLEEGIGLYENALKRNILKKEPCYGELYYQLGNLFYYVAEEYDSAFAHYIKAEESLFHNSDIVYKKGYIEYNRGDYRSALLEFAKAASVFSSNANLMYATGNAFFRRNDFFSALAQFYHTADLLEKQKDSIRGYDPQNRIAHYRTVEGLSMIYNNIGASLYGIYRTSGDHSKYVQALANLQRATEYRDLLFRDRVTMEGLNLEGSVSRLNSKTLLESDNLKAALYPTGESSVQIYDDLPKDMETDIFGFH